MNVGLRTEITAKPSFACGPEVLCNGTVSNNTYTKDKSPHQCHDRSTTTFGQPWVVSAANETSKTVEMQSNP